MKVAIVKNHKEKTLKVVHKLKRLLKETDIQLNQLPPDIVITVGGDGTLLNAFHQYYQIVDKISFVGIHTGHLGFYTDWRDYQLEELVDELVHSTPESVSYPLLELDVTDDTGKKSYLALNEATIKRMSQTLKADIHIKNEFFESFRGDGVCVATPTGSTAYSKSLGGAVLHPRLKALQLTEIASINNRIYRTLSSPIVIAPDEWITIYPESQDDYVVTLDSNELRHRKVSRLDYRIAKSQINFAKFRHTHFWSRVEDAFIAQKNNNEQF